jgi:DNA-directed RNA polymerase subunit M/transcription elongation factor TFIIS
LELTKILTIDDADVFWEFASFGNEKQLIVDFFASIKQTLETRETNPRFRAAANRSSIPHYYSLTFESPLLGEERKSEEERDGQLLRKDKPVRGAVVCPKCGDNLISTRQLQLRGLDEPSTNIYTCYSCPNMWSV